MDLEHDAFTVRYRPADLEPTEILEVIEDLGFSPRLQPNGTTITDSQEGGPLCEPWPEPIATALASARQDGKPLFLDFFAEWCAPCHTLEEEILPAPAVRQALTRFQFLRVDTDQAEDSTKCLEVFGLPTIVVLNPDGDELYRHQGLLSAETLADELSRLNP